METGMNFTMVELLAEIGAKTLVINRLNGMIAELQAALQAKNGEVPMTEEVVGTMPEPIAIGSNGAKGKG